MYRRDLEIGPLKVDIWSSLQVSPSKRPFTPPLAGQSFPFSSQNNNSAHLLTQSISTRAIYDKLVCCIQGASSTEEWATILKNWVTSSQKMVPTDPNNAAQWADFLATQASLVKSQLKGDNLGKAEQYLLSCFKK